MTETPATDLRRLCQAVVDAWRALCDGPSSGIAYLVHQQESDDAQRDLAVYLGITDRQTPPPACDMDEVALRILAALDAADAQDYARAMGEVVERCASHAEPRRVSLRAQAVVEVAVLDAVADWARERLPAASELAIPPTSSRQTRHDAGNRSG